MIRIALVDDHKILRTSLGKLIEMFTDFEIVSESDNGQQFIQQFRKNKIPDIVLMDITMPVMDGLETAQWLKKNHPKIKILALSMLKSDPIIINMIRNGVRGYILKDCDPLELQTALYDIYNSGYYYNELFSQRLKSKIISSQIKALSSQEITFLRWSCTDLTHKQIALEMKLSPRTIDGYRDILMRKLNVNSRIGLVIYAIKTGLVQL